LLLHLCTNRLAMSAGFGFSVSCVICMMGFCVWIVCVLISCGCLLGQRFRCG
jgi:hypothetical protein